MANIKKIKLPNGTEYDIKDSGALPLTGGTVTGPVIFQDSVTIDEATIGDLIVNGNLAATNNIQANTINGVAVGSSPKFTDTTYSSLAAASGGTAVSLVTTGEKYTWNSKTSNTGTVTKVTAGAGLSGGDITTTGTIAHSNSVTAQTTQAIYPIKIDAQGHISAYGTAVTPLTSHQTIKQDAVTGATGNHYASCTTAAATAAKTASITAGTPTLEAGLRVSVKFANANTAGTPTLNINSLGAKNIFHKGAQITTGSNKALLAGLVDFIYDGTQWHLVGNYLDTNTTYTASTTSIGSASAGTAISADDITAWTTNTPTAVTKKTVVTSASGATAAVSNGVLTLTNGSFGTGDSVTVTAGTAASLSYTSRSIPNISVTSTTVATGITAN